MKLVAGDNPAKSSVSAPKWEDGNPGLYEVSFRPLKNSRIMSNLHWLCAQDNWHDAGVLSWDSKDWKSSNFRFSTPSISLWTVMQNFPHLFLFIPQSPCKLPPKNENFPLYSGCILCFANELPSPHWCPESRYPLWRTCFCHQWWGPA